MERNSACVGVAGISAPKTHRHPPQSYCGVIVSWACSHRAVNSRGGSTNARLGNISLVWRFDVVVDGWCRSTKLLYTRPAALGWVTGPRFNSR